MAQFLGTNYQLYQGTTPIGGAVAGTGSSINFGNQTLGGTYTIVATNTANSCTANMYGSASVATYPLPTSFNVTGGGHYCASGIGSDVSLDGSSTGTYYQLYNGTTAVGPLMPGTGISVDFGAQPANGTYTVIARSSTTTCTATMNGSASVVTDPLPAVYNVSGGGSYCYGSGGLDVSLSSSDANINYQLFNGSVPGGVLAGSGSSLDFGPQIAGGTYTIVATNPSTTCSNNMSGSAAITVNSLPVAYTITGGGNYCAGGTGVHVGLGASNAGISYQLLNGGTPAGAAKAGTGSPIDFGLQTAPGNYTIVATNTATTCSSNMAGSATVGTNPLPAAHNIVEVGTNYCAGGTGIDISLNGSNTATSYQLYNGTTAVGTAQAGTGTTLDFGSQTAAGTYTVVAIDGITSCRATMTGTALVAINALPASYTVTGGGGYCLGGTGVHINLAGSSVGFSYQMYNGSTPSGAAITGNGTALDFGLQTATGIYKIIATNPSTGCTNIMTGTPAVNTENLPTVYNVTGGGSYCSGGSGVPVTLNNSASGITYQLYLGTTAVGTSVAGSGTTLSFGMVTAAGNYTIQAINTSTSCKSTMAGSANVAINSLPSSFAVTGGGAFCAGGDGMDVSVAGSVSGINYQLHKDGTAAGSLIGGTGAAIDFGMQTAAGTYTIVATNPSTSCSATMSGSAVVVVNALPAVYNVNGGGSYCAGGAGVHVGLLGSASGISYQLFDGATPSGSGASGSGSALDFGLQTVAGNYTVVATNATTGCSSNMPGSATVNINPTVTPSVNIATGVGNSVCAGALLTITATPVNGGTAPVYQWSRNGTAVTATGNSYSYLPADGDNIAVTLTSNAVCATPATANSSLTLSVNVNAMPTLSIAADPGNVVCNGSSVTYSAAASYGGTTPAYSWMVNGATVGTDATYTYMPSNGDAVYCVLNSNYQCRLGNNVPSSTINMEVDNPTPPVVSIAADPGTAISKGQTVTFTATVTNGGPAPAYQWQLNGADLSGQNGQTYTASNLTDQDVVTCNVLSSGGCSGIPGSGKATMSVSAEGVTQITSGAMDIMLSPNPNKGAFVIKGALGITTDETVTIQVTDMLGAVVYSQKVMTQGGNINEKVQLGGGTANGMYLVNLVSGAGSKTFHVVVAQ